MKDNKKRISGYISADLYDRIDEIAKGGDRSFNKTMENLLLQSIKERDRKRKKNATKEVHS